MKNKLSFLIAALSILFMFAACSGASANKALPENTAEPPQVVSTPAASQKPVEEAAATPSPSPAAETPAATAPVETPSPAISEEKKEEPSEPVQTEENTAVSAEEPSTVPEPVEAQDIIITDKEMTCFLSVSCNTILDNIDNMNPEKLDLVPDDGIIFERTEVVFFEGETVFNILQREMKKNKIHMEFVNTPVYKSAYIEGINNIYEFDCGELSGWTFKVNGAFPGYGSSRYQLNEGDEIDWVYTCDLGRDVGDQYFGSIERPQKTTE